PALAARSSPKPSPCSAQQESSVSGSSRNRPIAPRILVRSLLTPYSTTLHPSRAHLGHLNSSVRTRPTREYNLHSSRASTRLSSTGLIRHANRCTADKILFVGRDNMRTTTISLLILVI